MNSLAIIETTIDGYQLDYIAALISNVLRVNSAVEHQTFGMRIHRLMEKAHPPVKTAPVPETAENGKLPVTTGYK